MEFLCSHVLNGLPSTQTALLTKLQFKKQPKNLILIVVIPHRSDLQKAIKQWGDITHGIPTQIVNAETLDRTANHRPDQFLRNLALKWVPFLSHCFDVLDRL